MFLYRLLMYVVACIVCIKGAAGAPLPHKRSTRSLYVFGDSLSDTGRLHTMTFGLVPPEPYWEGRSSNGPLWVEYLALLQGLQLEDYAVGASESVDSHPDLFGLLPMAIPSTHDQIETFVKAHPKYSTSSSASGGAGDTAVLEMGGNDIISHLAGILASGGTQAAVDSFADSLATTVVGQVQRLRELGFRSVLVTNSPLLQSIPLIKLQNRVSVATNVVTTYNTVLAAKLKKAFGASFSSSSQQSSGSFSCTLIDMSGFMQLSMTSKVAGALGVKETGSSCIAGNVMALVENNKQMEAMLRLAFDLKDTLICDNPQDHFFWDPIHPNDRIHRLFGYYVNELIKAQAAGSGQAFALSEANILSLVSKHNLGSDTKKPAQI
ncbi:hypothetical protein GGH99_001926 [Coemansia sp. RSA 1285]|nr:hypothetical protein GGH99_001926 [Coemansia sp. RSA 1285]